MPDFKEYDPKEPLNNDSGSGGEPKKKKFKIKNKWFFIGLVAVLGLVTYQKIRQSMSGTSDDSGYYEVPLGYGGSGIDTGYYDDALETMANETNSAIESVYNEMNSTIEGLTKEWDYSNKEYESIIDEMSDQINAFDKKYDSAINTIEEQTSKMEYQNILTQMQENSDKALLSNNQAEKDYLHKLNTALGESIGAKFDSGDGYWYKDGKRLYSTALQSYNANTNLYSKPTSSSSSSVDRSSVLAQMEQNSLNWKTATTQEQKDALYKQNQELGKSIGLSYNSGSGKWFDSMGREAWNYDGVQDPKKV